ncbi:MAG: S9 family peptidase [Chitinophagaceae bacterium]
MKYVFLSLFMLGSLFTHAQKNLSPEDLITIGKVSFVSADKANKTVTYRVSQANIQNNNNNTKYYTIGLSSHATPNISSAPAGMDITFENPADDFILSPDKRKVAFSREVEVEKVIGNEVYSDLPLSNAYIYKNLSQRHWDTWEDGKYSHLFIADIVSGYAVKQIDLLKNEKFDCPQKPFGGTEDYLFSPDGQYLLYVTKKKSGKDYAISTNTDIYCYEIATGKTTNLTDGMEGYDTNPSFNADGTILAWQSMSRDGYESDKNDIWIMDWASKTKHNLTSNWDETTSSFRWSEHDSKIYFTAPSKGTVQLFEVNISKDENKIQQLTKGDFDIRSIDAQIDNTLILSRTDMNHAAELYTYNISNKELQQLTHANDAFYKTINMCDIKKRYTRLDNGEELFSWVIYPPQFDPHKKYPTLLYCQGGPQSALSQFYSLRWNFQLMASQGYIVIAPNRTGMPGWGTQWNEDISKDWGGNPIRDYLAAIDDIADEPYVDKNRLGAVGASYGGYSVFMLAGIHENRFKTFISHCGLFDLQSWYGTTEELWFANWDIGGAYWDKSNKAAQTSYKYYSPSKFVDNWNTPIFIIQGGRDYRVPIEQGLQAFQAAQLKGIKSQFLLLPDENHWVLKNQNALLWQREFFKWLKETL